MHLYSSVMMQWFWDQSLVNMFPIKPSKSSTLTMQRDKRSGIIRDKLIKWVLIITIIRLLFKIVMLRKMKDENNVSINWVLFGHSMEHQYLCSWWENLILAYTPQNVEDPSHQILCFTLFLIVHYVIVI